MTYSEAIRFWYGRINYEVRAAKPEDLKLERMREFLRRLGDPQKHRKTIHITGTKGKGSTAAMIAAIARAAGRRVGLFTSPHLANVEERIQVDGEPIPKADLAALMTRLKPVVKAMDRTPFAPMTFFEIVTALGWLHFLNRKVDLAVMEVGLGGRFDSTNVCEPAVTVITSVGYDHMAQLGDTWEKIAFQKAGILKKGVPGVIGRMNPAPRRTVEAVAADVGAPVSVTGIHFARDYKGPLGLLGTHQTANAAVARETIRLLNDPAITVHHVRAGLSDVRWPARIEVIARSPAVILDCAHNVPSIEALVKTLRREFPRQKNRTCIFAVSSDKQYPEMLRILATYFNNFYFTQYGRNPRCVPPEQLAALQKSTVCVPAVKAWKRARRAAGPNDLLCITGSVFLAGELSTAVRGR